MQDRSPSVCFLPLVCVALACGAALMACATSETSTEQAPLTKSPRKSSSTSPAESSASASGGSSGTPSPTDPSTFATCCSDRGKCVPDEMLPAEQLGDLNACSTAGTHCIPNEMMSKDFKGKSCTGRISALNSTYKGVCLSDCLGGESRELLSKDGCGDNETCIPCTHPMTGQPTGAPGCS